MVYLLTNLIRVRHSLLLLSALALLLAVCFVSFGQNSQKSSNSIPDLGVLNEKALRLPIPAYPPAARRAKACGDVTIRITINRKGNVVKGVAVQGAPQLRSVALRSARGAIFLPPIFDCDACRYVSGMLAYHFDCDALKN